MTKAEGQNLVFIIQNSSHILGREKQDLQFSYAINYAIHLLPLTEYLQIFILQRHTSGKFSIYLGVFCFNYRFFYSQLTNQGLMCVLKFPYAPFIHGLYWRKIKIACFMIPFPWSPTWFLFDLIGGWQSPSTDYIRSHLSSHVEM